MTRDVLRISDGILRYDRRDFAKGEIVRAVEHSAVRIAASVDEVVLRFLRRRDKHTRPVEILRDLRLWRFWPEVAEEDDERIAFCRLYFVEGGEHILFVLHCRLRFVDVAFVFERGDDCFAPFL